MNQTARLAPSETSILPDLRADCAAAVSAAQDVLALARARLAARVSSGGKVSNQALEADQAAAHALSWIATYVESLTQLDHWAARLEAAGSFGETEQLILQIGFGEYLSQLRGGIPMSQGEMARLGDLGLDQSRSARDQAPASAPVPAPRPPARLDRRQDRLAGALDLDRAQMAR